jgi:hypothetical protein
LKHFFIILLTFFPALVIWGVEWTPGMAWPESAAVTKTVAEIMQAGDHDSNAAQFYSKIPSYKQGSFSPNFTAARYEDSWVIPPDAMGVVGPSQFILAANGRIRSFDKKSGLADGILDISTGNFFKDFAKESFTSDSRIRYDRFSDRWVILILAATANPVRVMFAVSDSGIITNQTKWNFFYIEPRSDAAADYPTLGIDKHALYIGVNIMKKHYVTSDAFVINKAALLEGKLRMFAFQNLVTPIQIQGPTTPQGVDNFDADATEGFFIGLDGTGDRLILKRIKDPSGKPSISENIPIAIGDLASPLRVPQKGSFNSKKFFLQGFDKRLCSPHIRNKQLYVAHNVGVDNQGKAEKSTPTRDGCKWYQINMTDPVNPSIAQTGILYQPSKFNDLEERYFWMPGIMTNGLNTMMICCSTSGDNDFANAAYALRFSNDPPGTMREPRLFTNTHVVYTLGFPPFEDLRWGEYSHASVDPLDNMTFWDIAEFSLTSTSWGLQVIRILPPPPAKIIQVIPSVLQENQKDIQLKILGERLDGSAFYDPGEGFPNRLKVEIKDVQIQSIKWVSAIEIDLVVSTTQASKKTFKDIKITNPDGQTQKVKKKFQVISKNPK